MPFPTEVFAPAHREMIEEVAESTKSDPAMAAMTSLGVLGAALGGKVAAQLPSGLIARAHIWVCVGAPSCTGKSEVLKAMTAPIDRVYVASQAAEPDPSALAPPRVRSAYDYLTEPEEEDPASLAPAINVAEVAEILRARQAVAFPDVPVDFLVNDTTPTRLLDLIGSQEAGVSLFSAESGFERWLMKNSEVAAQDRSTLVAAWDGVRLTRQRMNRRIVLNRPALTLVVMMQLEPLHALVHHRGLRSTAFISRFLICQPRSNRGYRMPPFRPPSRVAVNAYEAYLLRLLALAPVWPSVPNTFTREAVDVNDAYYAALEVRMREGEDLEGHADVVDRLRANIPRIALLLHVSRARRLDTPVGPEAMAGAVQIAEYLLPQTLALYPRLGSGAVLAGSQDDSPLLEAVSELLNASGGTWEGTPTDLLYRLASYSPSGIPNGPQSLTRRLRELRNQLAFLRIQIEPNRTSQARSLLLRRTAAGGADEAGQTG